jgi:peroxiredoxin
MRFLRPLAALALASCAPAPPEPHVTREAWDVTLEDTGGSERRPFEDRGRLVVLAFLGTQCPASNGHLPELAALHREFDGSAAFWGVYPNAEDQPLAAAHAADWNVPFPCLKDPRQELADALGVDRTPTVVVADAMGHVHYRGRIDDDPMGGRATVRDLREALAACVAGTAPAVASTTAWGCLIHRAGRASEGPVTYARDVAPILAARCVECHRKGQVGPMPLTDYEHASAFAAEIGEATGARRMPPWKPTGGVAMVGDRRLPEREIETLRRWAAAGAPRGNPRDEPALPRFTEGWLLGQPDLELRPAEEYELPARGEGPADSWRYFVIPTDLPADVWVSAAEVRPGNQAITHHVIAMVDVSGKALELDAGDEGPGYGGEGTSPGFVPVSDMGGWTPGYVAKHAPEGIARKLPKGATVVLQMHYNRTGGAQRDRPVLGLHFAKSPVRKQVRLGGMARNDFEIPAGAEKHAVRATWTVPKDITLISVMPHMHLLGKTAVMSAKVPEGQPFSLIEIGDWDFKWQDAYILKDPVKLPRGTELALEATYDNSEKNPRNPARPPVVVRHGQKTTDEMCLGLVAFTVDDEDLIEQGEEDDE